MPSRSIRARIRRAASSIASCLALVSILGCSEDPDDGEEPARAFLGVNANRRASEPLLAEAYREIAQGSFAISGCAISWGEIERRAGNENWESLDLHGREAREDALPLAITILLLDNQARGSTPDDTGPYWIEDAFYRQRVARFARRVATRFPGVCRYLWIGREVDAYFAQNSSEVDDWITLVNTCRDSVRAADPAIEVGTIVSYSEALLAGRLDLCDRLAAAGSVVGLTVYGRDLDYAQTHDPDGSVARIEAAVGRFSIRPLVLTEVGFPAARSDASNQERFVRGLTGLLETPPAHLRGALWSSLHDFAPEVAAGRAQQLYAGEPTRAANYEAQLRSLGLLNVDGSLRSSFLAAQDWNTTAGATRRGVVTTVLIP